MTAALAVLVTLVVRPAPAHPPAGTALARLDAGLASAARYLVRKQSRDGAWRSETYGALKDGASVTPLVLSALFFVPQSGRSVPESYRRGVGFLVGFVGPVGEIAPGPSGFDYPVLSSAMAGRVVTLQEATPANRRAGAAWLAYLRARQLNARLGWSPSDREFGGWGFSLRPPVKPRRGETRDEFVESNLVATVFGIGALRSAKVPPDDAGYREALHFAVRCQNFAADAAHTDRRFDDGGFYFIPGDALQNKAGVAGRDRFGRTRFRSYGTMTADGLRVLLRCGLPPTHPRILAARRWLERNFSPSRQPGAFPADREVLRGATYYYYAWSVAHAFAAVRARKIVTSRGARDWAAELSGELLRRQRRDGSWANRFTDAKEDDPLVATPWAAAALAICREVLTGEQRSLVPRRHL
jgi:hypothetical protein